MVLDTRQGSESLAQSILLALSDTKQMQRYHFGIGSKKGSHLGRVKMAVSQKVRFVNSRLGLCSQKAVSTKGH